MQTGVAFSHQTVQLDGETFSNCEFSACRMIYAGGDLPIFEDCRFDGCDWKYEDASARTLSYLKLIWGVGAKASVQTTIKEITVAAR